MAYQTFFQYLRLSKEEKNKYYLSAPIICTNCQKSFKGYFTKVNLIVELACPHCECYYTLQNVRTIKEQ